MKNPIHSFLIFKSISLKIMSKNVKETYDQIYDAINKGNYSYAIKLCSRKKMINDPGVRVYFL